MEKLRTNYVLKSRIVALALISIMLSSSSFSVADGYTIWFEVMEINAVTTPNSNEQFYKINLKDVISARLSQHYFDYPQPYKIKLFDSASVFINDKNKRVDQTITEQIPSKIIFVNLADGIGTNTTDYDKDYSKIVLIKQDDDRKALWERIFPLDRIRNGIKSFYKIIQNDHSLSYIQMDEIGSNNYDYSLEQAPIYGSELEQMLEFDKFAGKAGYVADQIGIRANNLLDVNKFVGKANFVGIQLADHTARLADPQKFVGKAGYVYNQLAIHAQHYTDPEKFVGKSKFVGQQITIAVYHTVDPKQPTLLVLLVPLISFVLIRNENEKIKFYHIQKIVSYIFIVILVSSSVIAPFSYSVMYWGYAFGQEDPLGEDIGPPEESPPVEKPVELLPESIPVEEPVELPPESIPVEEPVELPPELAEEPIPETTVDETPPEQNIASTQQPGNDLTTTFDEIF